jgi:hypothetical protein
VGHIPIQRRPRLELGIKRHVGRLAGAADVDPDVAAQQAGDDADQRPEQALQLARVLLARVTVVGALVKPPEHDVHEHGRGL